jgi:hypothetical protein
MKIDLFHVGTYTFKKSNHEITLKAFDIQESHFRVQKAYLTVQ